MTFFDLQVNGYAGVDFNSDDWTDEQLLAACRRLAADRVDGILATIITDDLSAMERRLSRLVAARVRNHETARVILGFHIEGPFLNEAPGYIGAHPPAAALTATCGAMQRLLDAAAGLTRVVTLAPERDPGFQVTRMLVDQNVIVSAGHCNPSLAELEGAIDAGLSMVTHLGNGCPLQLHRHDNVIQRLLHHAARLWIGFIADGVHIPYFALQNYLQMVGFERSFVVTDAIAAAGQGPGRYRLGQCDVIVDESLATWSPDRTHLMGSASTMPRMAENLITALRLAPNDVERLLWHNPRRAIGEA